MKRFVLQRLEDETGVSGIGIVAEGVQFTNGTCVLIWLTEIRSIAAIYESIDIVNKLHGHDGKTFIEWIDLNGSQEQSRFDDSGVFVGMQYGDDLR